MTHKSKITPATTPLLCNHPTCFHASYFFCCNSENG